MAKVLQWVAILGLLVAVGALLVDFFGLLDPTERNQLFEERAQGTELAKQTALLGEFQDIQNQILALSRDSVDLNRRLADLERRLSDVERSQAASLVQQLDDVWDQLAENHSRLLDLQARQIAIADELEQSGAKSPGFEVIEIADLPPRPDYQMPAPPVYEQPPPPVYVLPTEPPLTATEPPEPEVPVYESPQPVESPIYDEPSEPEVVFTPAEPSRDCSSGTVSGTSSRVSSGSGCAEAMWDGCTPVRVLINDREVVRLDQNALAGSVRVCTPGTFALRVEDASGSVYSRSSMTVSR